MAIRYQNETLHSFDFIELYHIHYWNLDMDAIYKSSFIEGFSSGTDVTDISHIIWLLPF